MSVSKTTILPELVAAIARRYDIKPWEKKGDARYYLDLDALADIIGLEQAFYNTGNCSGCSYIDSGGDTVTVAHSRAYGKGYLAHKTYICNGRVYSDWEPYGADIAELIAARIMEPALEGGLSASASEGR